MSVIPKLNYSHVILIITKFNGLLSILLYLIIKSNIVIFIGQIIFQNPTKLISTGVLNKSSIKINKNIPRLLKIYEIKHSRSAGP